MRRNRVLFDPIERVEPNLLAQPPPCTQTLRREIADLHAIIGRKDAHITSLERLIRQIERGRLMRLLQVFNRT